MKRILFVDDDAQILDALRRVLRAQRAEWDMVFVTSGDEALAALEAAPFDVVVSDVHMPRMDGLTLLEKVRSAFPRVMRIVFSGTTDPHLALHTIPVAHQSVPKPCDVETLRRAIGRASDLEGLLLEPSLRAAIGAMDRLPTSPTTFAALSGALKNQDVSLGEIVELIERDTAMCAKILQLVNSAFFGLPRHVTDIATAVNRLGTAALRDLVLSIEVFRTFPLAAPIPGFSLEAVQSHALLTAGIARRMLPGKELAADAFMAGMLHDVGVLVLATQLPDRLKEALRASRLEKRPLHQAEQSLGSTHAEVGAHLLALWGLPPAIVEAVANHHEPARVHGLRFDLVSLVHIANALAHEVDPHPAPGEPAAEHLDIALLETLGVTDRLPAWRALAAEQASALPTALID